MGWEYGFDLEYLQSICRYWREKFDWKAELERLARLHHLQFTTGDQSIHFVHEHGSGPAPIPILLLHGWPGSFLEMLKLVPRLTNPAAYGGEPHDSFDVVVASLPGFGFSSRPRKRGMNTARMSDLLDLSGAQQGDGAGGNAHFTPEFMVSFLAYMSKQKEFQSFYDALPILGRDGTLFDIQTKSPAAGHVHAKTGTLAIYDPLNRRLLVTGKGLAGYLTTRSGEHLAFAIYVNNVSVPTEGDTIKRITGEAVAEIAAAFY